MKTVVTNIVLLILFIAVCMGIAYVLPEWSTMGIVLFLLLLNLTIQTPKDWDEKENEE